MMQSMAVKIWPIARDGRFIYYLLLFTAFAYLLGQRGLQVIIIFFIINTSVDISSIPHLFVTTTMSENSEKCQSQFPKMSCFCDQQSKTQQYQIQNYLNLRKDSNLLINLN